MGATMSSFTPPNLSSNVFLRPPATNPLYFDHQTDSPSNIRGSAFAAAASIHFDLEAVNSPTLRAATFSPITVDTTMNVTAAIPMQVGSMENFYEQLCCLSH
jgi:hypothetical protein